MIQVLMVQVQCFCNLKFDEHSLHEDQEDVKFLPDTKHKETCCNTITDQNLLFSFAVISSQNLLNKYWNY